MTLHTEPAAHARATVTADIGRGDEQFRIEDWWDRVSGGSWMSAQGNPAALIYAMRSAGKFPADDEVLYGKDFQGMGHLLHVSEVRS
jgi:hypothetical protein